MRRTTSRTMDVLRALPEEGCIHRGRLATAVGRDPAEVGTLVHQLVARGLVVRLRPGCYQITALGRTTRDASDQRLPRQRRSPVPRRPKRRTIADAVWWHMRAERGATLDALLSLLDRDPPPASRARVFLTALARAGYVAVDRRKRSHRFVLLKNTGPATPQVDPARQGVWDPNTRSFAPFVAGAR